VVRSATLANPFIYETPVEPPSLIGRQVELSTLLRRAGEARNSRIEGPRRFGKTSVIRAVLHGAADQGLIPVEVNFLGCVTAAEVAQRIEEAYAAQLDSPLRRWLSGVLETLNPTVRAAPGGVGVQAQPRPNAPGLRDRLDLPRRIHERTGRHCVIAFDEFQEVVRIDDALPGVFRSVLESAGHRAAYIFTGSHPGLMRELFSDRRHAFFGQASRVSLGPLPAAALVDAIGEGFDAGNRDPGSALDPLLDRAEGHPQRAMLLAHHLFEQTPPAATADGETWLRTLDAARSDVHGEIQVLWDSCTALERRVLKVIAQRTLALGGREAEARFGVVKGGGTQTAVRRLALEGHLIEDETTRTGWRVVDPLLGDWLRS
jgi:hypothetical protein